MCVELLGSMKYVGKAAESLRVDLAFDPLAASRVAASKLGRPSEILEIFWNFWKDFRRASWNCASSDKES